MTPNLNNSENLFVANLQQVSLEKLVKSKLEVLFQQQKEAQVELNGLYNIVLEQVERPLIELALKAYNGNQVKTALMLGINRNTLKKKIDNYKVKPKKGAAATTATPVAASIVMPQSIDTNPVLTQ
jgi:Fis family transcriptional regulator